MSRQMTLISLEELVPSSHIYRQFCKVFNFDHIIPILKQAEFDGPHKGYGIVRLFKCLLLQFMEDLSDRELERFLQENTSAKWFCEFDLSESTPTYSIFSRIRSKIGTKRLSSIFSLLRDQLRSAGYMSETFTFIDATHLISKANLWKERDDAIKKKYEKLNNKTLPKVAYDKDARIGCKGKDKFWYGYKKHESVDMPSGFINKVAVTAANLTDGKGFKHVCPKGGAVYADKAYCVESARIEAKRRNIHLAAIKKNNMKGKNKDLDRWYTSIRSPYERVFSQQNRRVRYVGIAKNQFAEFMNAICFNMKRMLVLAPPDIAMA